MKQTVYFLCGLISITFFSVACAPKTNLYMTADSPNFKTVTQNFVGDWVISEYKKENKDLLVSPFDKASVSFDFDTQKAKYMFWVSEATLAEKLMDWQQTYPGLKVDEYKIAISTQWLVKESGAVIDTDPMNSEENHEIIIKGSGENFSGFYDIERSKFAAGKNTGKGQGLMGMAMGAIAKKATGTSDLFLSIADNYTFEFSDAGKSLLLCRKGAVYKENLQDCKERITLKKKM